MSSGRDSGPRQERAMRRTVTTTDVSLRHLGEPIVSVVVTGYRGIMADDLRALGFLPHRNPARIEASPP